MPIDGFAFGTIRIDRRAYERHVVIDRDELRLRKQNPSKQFRDGYDQTPLSTEK